MKILIRLILAFLILGILGIGSVVGILFYFSLQLPKVDSLANYRPPIPSRILAKDGTVLAEVGVQKRELVSMEDVPKVIVSSFIAAEDDNFYKHHGVDYVGILRAMVKNLKAGRIVQGGSTITQQVAKALLLSNERKYSRKIKDMLLAWKIEKRFTKEEILYLYLNHVYLGGGYYGIKSAFRGYFDKELDEATIAESAMIAGLLVAPGKYSPYIHPEYAKNRQAYVLQRLLVGNVISQEEYDAAKAEKIKFRLKKDKRFLAGYFTDWVRQRVVELVGSENFLKNGFVVSTTLDYDLQKVAEKAVKEGAIATDKRQGYKGVLGHFETDDEITKNDIKFRTEFYKKRSNYFTLSDDNQRVYEISFNDDIYNKTIEYRKLKEEEVQSSRFVSGNRGDDPLIERLNFRDYYKAVILKVSNRERMIYVTIGGIVGIIPYEYFRWVHERNITTEKKFYPYLIKPETVFKKGDIILVKVLRKSVSVWKKFQTGYRKSLQDFKKLKEIKEQRYLLCSLEQEPDVQTALISISPQTGEIKSFVGGTNFNKSQFNRIVQSMRQPGSSFKPFIYAAGLENGFTLTDILIDSPEALLGGIDSSLNWKPRNYNGKFMGPITFRRSLELSKNVTTIKLAHSIGVNTIINFVKRIGFNAELDKDLSLSLGSFGIPLIDLVASYAIFPNGGRVVDPKSIISIIDRDGNTFSIDENVRHNAIVEAEKEKQLMLVDLVGENSEELLDKSGKVIAPEEEKKNPYLETLGGDQVYDKRLAYLMTRLMRGVISHGTGRSARHISKYIGGKTGTTNSYVDALFVGFSHNLATGVWTGFDNNKTLGWGETGAKASLPVWAKYMKAGLKKYGEQDFPVPPGIVNVVIDRDTGKLAKYRSKNRFTEAFVDGTEPGSVSDDNKFKKVEERPSDIMDEDDYYNVQ